jgi:hypothetical protein
LYFIIIAYLLHPVDRLAVELFLNGDMCHGRSRRGTMPMSLAVAQSGSKSIQQQQNYSFIAKLTGNNTIAPVNTNATGIAKFYADAAKY